METDSAVEGWLQHTEDVCPFITYCGTKFETVFVVSYFGNTCYTVNKAQIKISTKNKCFIVGDVSHVTCLVMIDLFML